MASPGRNELNSIKTMDVITYALIADYNHITGSKNCHREFNFSVDYFRSCIRVGEHQIPVFKGYPSVEVQQALMQGSLEEVLKGCSDLMVRGADGWMD